MTRSMMESETLFGKSNEPLSVTIFTVLQVESYSTWQTRHWDTCSSSSLRTSGEVRDRKSTRLNSSHQIISYAVFCLKKKKIDYYNDRERRGWGDYLRLV